MLLVREGLGCCCGMTRTASDSSRKLSRRGERASSTLFTTLHSLLHPEAPSHNRGKDSGECCSFEVVPEQLHAGASMPGMVETDAMLKANSETSPLLEVDPPADDKLWVLCDVGQGQLGGKPQAGELLSPM